MPEEKMIRVGKKCPKCGRRLFDVNVNEYLSQVLANI